MEWDKDREAEKRREILDNLTLALEAESASSDLASAVFDNFVTTTPPEAPEQVMKLMVMRPMGEGGGRSTKAGNVKLNIGKLIEAIASGVLVSSGVVQLPITAPFAALVIWCSLWRSAQLEISENDAGVLYAMWTYKDSHRDVEENGLLDQCNSLFAKYGRPPISPNMLRASLKTLERVEVIERSPRDGEAWWLREWVRVSYR